MLDSAGPGSKCFRGRCLRTWLLSAAGILPASIAHCSDFIGLIEQSVSAFRYFVFSCTLHERQGSAQAQWQKSCQEGRS